jgi:PKHD-type hydroxylase
MDTLYTFPLNFDTYVNQTNYYWFAEGFTPEELTEIERLTNILPFQQAVTEGGKQDEGIGLEARQSMIKWVPQSSEFKWIYDKIGMLATTANEEMFKFDIHSMPEMIQYTEYYATNKGHYDWHMDIGSDGYMKHRKISVTVQLSGPDEYDGGDLQIWQGGQYPNTAPRGKGNVVIFPSFMMHRVTPVTRGTRKSFVLWLGGGHYR